MSFNLRQNFAQTLQSEIAEIIDEVCSESVGEDESIKIDRIELDMGSFSKHTFGTDFKKVFSQQLRNELAKKLSGIPPEVRQASRRLSNTEILFYFLTNGALPWFADETTLHIDGIFNEAVMNQADILTNFFYHGRFIENIWKRVLWQLNEQSKGQVLNLFTNLQKVRETFTNWVTQISNQIAGSKSPVFDLYDTGFLEQFSNVNDAIIKNAPLIFPNPGNTAVLVQIFKTHIVQVFTSNKTLSDSVSSAFDNLISSNPDESTISRALPPSAETSLAEDQSPGYSIEDVIEKYTVKYAGIVLLAPFLKSFFTELNLLDGSDWKKTESAFRAVHLLKYLGNGQKKIPEYSLVFEKILCGLPVDMPIPLDVFLNDTEIAEADSLLKAVITHWSVLKNTSIDGLRETFIKRDGLIIKKDNGWLLQVERKTLDVLLDKIPWGYSTITLGWNPYLVFVEW
jgi:hypothetical protein